jgi:diguanylate cyclase (GGDEF)-like protein
MLKFNQRKHHSRSVEAEALMRQVKDLREEAERLRIRICELEGLAGTDDLTGLPNRRSFLKSLEKLIDRVSRYDESAGLIFVDVDGLKRINDLCGHPCGDAALIHIARLLVEAIRSSDCVGRLAGDEFGILVEKTDELGAWQSALRVVELVTGSEFAVEGRPLRLSVAVGVAMIKPYDNPTEVIARADEQMYRIKAPECRKSSIR